MPHVDTTFFTCICAGNEVIPGELANYVLPAMKNLDAALKAVGRKIPVSTAVPSNVLGTSYPPSAGEFSAMTAPNLFLAMVDAVYAAVEKAGGSTVRIVVSETGWPSAGGDGVVATIDNARMYNRNLISHLALNPGTPRRPGENLETYIFALFNENLKDVGTERNFGLFYPNMTEVYRI
ncbi:hypothetical protein MKW94_030920 [Papaver nudicaule]|uniref:Glucan endo-1,3-beta-D-glucosidase n=1 Tax=Papaver nudicaule TaxID=74823 RepID=A0AA41RZ34_PAPNU|nr:hypothetical protein [Papaver nudicaule]